MAGFGDPEGDANSRIGFGARVLMGTIAELRRLGPVDVMQANAPPRAARNSFTN
jgi:hypothetical protein